MVVHTSSLGAVLPPGSDDVVAVLEGLRPTATLSYDVNARPVVTGTGPEIVARVERIAGLADVVKASDEDVEALWPDLTLAESARHLLSFGPAIVVITRGPEGALWVTSAAEGVVAAVPVVVADTIGAGDTFGAALIDGLWDRGLLGAEHREDARGPGRRDVERRARLGGHRRRRHRVPARRRPAVPSRADALAHGAVRPGATSPGRGR